MVWHMLGSCSDAKISLFLFVTVNQLETVSLNSSWSRISFAGLRRRGGISSLSNGSFKLIRDVWLKVFYFNEWWIFMNDFEIDYL